MNKQRILVVEDEAIVAFEIQDLLERLGWDVLAAAATGQDAIEKAGELRPDLVLMDIRLQGEMDGIEAAGQILVRFDIPVIFLTAFADDATVERTREVEPYGYLLKPFDSPKLVSTITTALDRHGMVRKLRESEERFRALSEASPVGVYRMDSNGNCVYANQRWADISGFSVKQALGTGWTQSLHPDDRERVSEKWRRSLQESLPFSAEYRLQHANGKTTWVLGRAASERDRHGEITGYVGTLTDITELKQLADELRHSEKMQAIGQLAGGVAHDFNNQLGGIMNYADLVLERTEDEELHRYIEAIIRACARGKDLTGQLLAFARKGKFQAVPLDVHQTVSEVACMLGRSGDKRVRIHQHLEANPSFTIGDPTQIQNALLNLGLNARDAMLEGGELVFATDTVALGEEFLGKSTFDVVPGDYVRIRVTDSGTGMDADTRARVFEPFFTTKEQGKGTGMGLASVYGTVINHHGAIEVESEIGKGTTMTLYLPLSQQQTCEVVEEGVTSSEVKGSERILIVDDEKSVRESTAELLRGRGYRVVTAGDGVEAVEYYGKSWGHVDLAIVDMNMPGLNGRDTYIAMREINPAIKAILATGYSLDSRSEEVLDEGVLSHLQKPFRIHDLVLQIEQALGG